MDMKCMEEVHGHEYMTKDTQQAESSRTRGSTSHANGGNSPCMHATPSQELQSAVFGNPHSASPSSQRTTKLVEKLREDLLAFFGADPDEYTVGASVVGGCGSP